MFGAQEMSDSQEFERVIREMAESELRKDNALMKCSYSAKAIKRIVARIKSGERELEQALWISRVKRSLSSARRSRSKMET